MHRADGWNDRVGQCFEPGVLLALTDINQACGKR